MPRKLTPLERVPDDVAAMFAAHGLPDYYDGPVYTGDNGAMRAAREISELVADKSEGADSAANEVAPLPPGFGRSADD